MTQIDEPNLDKCDCICHSPAFYAPHKTGHACCDDANVIEDNSLLVRTTNIAEHNLDEQIDKALEELVFYGRDNIGVTDEAVLARKAIKALIADQVARARTTLLRDLNDCGEIHHSVYDYRIEELEQDK